MALPRILFLTSEAPHSAAAGAIVLQRLFAGYPTDRLLILTGQLPPPGASRLDCTYLPLDLQVNRFNRTRFWPWRTALRVLGGPDWLSLDAIDRAIAGYQPELVVTLMQDSWYYDLAARYARARALPLFLFIHDLPDGFEPVASWLHSRQYQRDRDVYRCAAKRACISEPMARHFAREFGVPGDVLLPPRSDQAFSRPLNGSRSLVHPGRLTLGYAGGLHYGYGEQLQAMLPVLRSTGTVVELYGPRPAGSLAKLNEALDVLHFHGYAATPEAAWRGILERCDVVLQPYLDPPGVHARQYETHFPSKLGDCLALGLPLLVTGPADASGLAWCAARPGTALTVSGGDQIALVAALERLRDDSALREALARGARVAAEAFNPGPLRAHLHNLLADAASGH